MTGHTFAVVVQHGTAVGVSALVDSELVDLYRHPTPHPDRPWLRTNFVSTLDGGASGTDGRTGSINTGSDHEVFALLRAHADAVLVGAQTARAESYRAVDLEPWQAELRQAEGLSPYPTLVILSRSLDFSPELIESAAGEAGVTVITDTSQSGERVDRLRAASITVEEIGTRGVDLAAAVEHLAGSGRPRLLCEGGPVVHSALLRAGLVDEMCLTLAPSVVGGDGPRSTGGVDLGERVDFRLEHLLVADDSTVFTRYLRG